MKVKASAKFKCGETEKFAAGSRPLLCVKQ